MHRMQRLPAEGDFRWSSFASVWGLITEMLACTQQATAQMGRGLRLCDARPMSQALQNRLGSGGGDDVALALVEGNRVSESGERLVGLACAIEHRGEVEEGVAALRDVVGALRELHGVARCRFGCR